MVCRLVQQQAVRAAEHQEAELQARSFAAGEGPDRLTHLLLGRFLFRYEQMRQPVGTLSGGERTRLQLCLLMLGGANCLLLDEPTNHLDIESMEVLESTLESFDGTVLVISHDRYLLDRIPDRIVEVRDGRVTSTVGGYDDWAVARSR